MTNRDAYHLAAGAGLTALIAFAQDPRDVLSILMVLFAALVFVGVLRVVVAMNIEARR